MKGEDARDLAVDEEDDTGHGDALSPFLTVQASSTTHDVVIRLRDWAGASNACEHYVITGPPGCGSTHLLDALAGNLPVDQTIRCSSSDPDWKVALASIGGSESRCILVNDLDGYDNSFLKQFFVGVSEQKHRMVASMKVFDGRRSRLWTNSLTAPRELRLGSLNERVEDVAAFLPYWARIKGCKIPTEAAFGETLRLLMAMKLPHGFCDLVRLLDEVVAVDATLWDPPEAAVWIDAYTRTVMGPRKTRPVILVEGNSDVMYIHWVSELMTGFLPQDVEIQSCQSAGRIPEKAFACRNEGRPAVALLDHDRVGLELHAQMKGIGLSSFVIPDRFDPLAGSAPDHLKGVVEIEDLVPTTDIEQFVSQTGCQPELVIEAPRARLKRIVIWSEDKVALARWVSGNLGTDSAHHVLDVYNELRRHLGLTPVTLPASTINTA